MVGQRNAGGVCQAPTCADGVRNGRERNVDCGGGVCRGCVYWMACNVALDCESGVCTGGWCAPPSCTDGVRNGFELDIDCGDPQGDCPRCSVGKRCDRVESCESGRCDEGVCQAASCTDGVRDQDESDVDCGGAHCAGCLPPGACNQGNDCQSLVCRYGRCDYPWCGDGVKNGEETGVDCGGWCEPCAAP